MVSSRVSLAHESIARMRSHTAVMNKQKLYILSKQEGQSQDFEK